MTNIILSLLLLVVCRTPLTALESTRIPVFSTNGIISMRERSISINDFDKLKETLSKVVEKVSSLEEFETWLKSQEYIQSVSLQNFLIKTNPPQKEFIVEFKINDGSTRAKAIDIFVLENGRFRFSRFHEP